MEVSVNTSSENVTNQTNINYEKFSDFTVVEGVLLTTAVFGIIGDVLIITVLLKFVKTKTYYNTYLVSWCTSNGLFLLSTPLLSYLENRGCYFIFTGAVLLAANLFFVAVLSLDWFITTYYSTKCAPNCRYLAKFINFVAWLLVLVFLLNIIVFCSHKIQIHVALVLVLFCLVFLCFIGICVQLLCLVKRKTSSVVVIKSYLVLVLVTSFMLGWMPTFLCFIYEFIGRIIRQELMALCFSFGQLNPFVNLFLLYRYDRQFKVGFRTLSKCRDESNFPDDVDLDKQNQYAAFTS